MKIGIALPVGIVGVSGDRIVEWAREVEAGPFSSVSVLDRVAYFNYEPLIALAAAAAVTKRVQLVTAALLATVRNTGILAKSAASLDALSGGRLTLGLGIGLREDDFWTAPAEFKGRGRRFEQSLATMRRMWAGERVAGEFYPVGPTPARPGGPELLLGGRTPKAVGRVGRWADGYLAPGLSPQTMATLLGVVEQSWKKHGRQGRPRIVSSGCFCALGPGAAERAASNVRHYFAFQADGGAAEAGRIISTPRGLKDLIAEKAGLGFDEILLSSWVQETDQIQRIADVVG